jgi:hypothetical protein
MSRCDGFKPSAYLGGWEGLPHMLDQLTLPPGRHLLLKHRGLVDEELTDLVPDPVEVIPLSLLRVEAAEHAEMCFCEDMELAGSQSISGQHSAKAFAETSPDAHW